MTKRLSTTARILPTLGLPGHSARSSGASHSKQLLPGHGEELIRQALEDLVLLRERDPNHREGVSQAELAEDLGVSTTRVQAILDANQPTVNLRAGQIPALRPRARKAVLRALLAVCDELDGTTTRKAPDSRARQVGALYGQLNATLETALEDKVLDRQERAELRARFSAIATAATAGVNDLEE